MVASSSLQISLPDEVIAEVDRRRGRKGGRSAYIRRAVEAYLEAERRRAVDHAYARGYAGKADAVFDEFKHLIGSQRWPRK